jgi:hypothetical protein
MAKVIIPQWVAVIDGVRCDISPAVRDHYLKPFNFDEARFEAKTKIKIEQNGVLEVDTDDSVAIAKATLGGDPDDRR